jgi:hypothetical protein
MWACLCLLLTGCAAKGQIGSTVGPSAIRQIRLGMSEQEVEKILGRPIRVRPWGSDAAVHDYGVKGWGQGIAFWIHFGRGVVELVHVEQYHAIRDHHALYELQAGRPAFESADFTAAFSRR